MYINIPVVAKYEWHPFTISSAPEQQGKTTGKHIVILVWQNYNNVTLDYRINKLSIDVWFVRIGQYLAEMKLFEYLESEKIKLRKSPLKLSKLSS